MEVITSTSAFLVKLTCIACLLCLLSLSPNHPGVDCQDVWNNDKLRTLAEPFQVKFRDFATHALQKEALKDLFYTNVYRSGTPQSSEHGSPHQRQTLRPEEAARQLMSDLKDKLVQRYSAVVTALQRLRQAFEDGLTKPLQQGSGRQELSLCCPPATLGQHGPPPSMSYEVVHHDLVDTETGCAGSTGSLLDPNWVAAGDAFRVMKDNYNNWTGLLWQHVTTTDGYFLQFPRKDRHCGPNGTITYPFLQRREVEKLLQPQFNLVILLDASNTMSQTVASGAARAASLLSLTKEAVKSVISDLGFGDRVSVVIMQGTNVSTPDCSQRLMPATERNAARLATFLESVNASDSPAPDHVEGLRKAYSLLKSERAFQSQKNVTEIILLFTNDGYEIYNIDAVLKVIDTEEYSMGRTVTHLVYVSQSQQRNLRTLDGLYMVADLNNLQIPRAPSWPPEYRYGAGPVGKLEVIQDTLASRVKDTVREHYRQFVQTKMGTNAAERVLAAAAPLRDSKLGLLLSFVIPMFNNSRTVKDYSSLLGAAAVDVSMTSLFDDVIHFNWMSMSYCFLVERDRGLVLVHPNLENPSNLVIREVPIFASLDTLEPTLTAEQRAAILTADASIQSFGAQFGPGRNAFRTGLDLSGMPTTPATVVYSLVSGTDYVLVMVIFNKELEPVPLGSTRFVNTSLDVQRFPHYQMSGTSDTATAICAFSSDSLVANSVTVKVSPDVFREPELHLHRNSHDPTNISPFVNGSEFSVRPELRNSVRLDLEVVGGQRLFQLWKDTANSPGVIARFVGTRNGVFAAYPGVWPPNTVIENDYSWYRLSLAAPGKVLVTLRRSLTTRDRFVVISTTVGDTGSIVGVSGAMVSRRGFAALVYNTVPQCSDNGFSCHLLTEDGHFLDVLREGPEMEARRHVTSVYPWLANEMIRQHIMKPFWCTSLSRGRHTLTYALLVPEGQARNNTQDPNPCRRFLLHHVLNSNLFLLALLNRQRVGCTVVDTSERCSSCTLEPEGYRCIQCMPKNASLPMTPLCQCLCSCPVDVDVCDGSYQTHVSTFPLRSCYEGPEMPNLMPAVDPGNRFSVPPPCEMMCPTADSQERCEALGNCQWNHENYPVCQASKRSTTTAFGLAGTTQRQVMKNDGSSGHSLGGGAIAGISILALVALTAAFLIAYYRLVKPGLFSRMTEDADLGDDDSAHFQSHDDSLTFTIHPSLPTSASPPPASTACKV